MSIGIAKSNAWDVSVGSFVDSLLVSVWIANNDEAWFNEFAVDGLVSEETWGEALVNAWATKELAELVDSTLAKWLLRNSKDIAWFFDAKDHAGSKLNLFKGHLKVDDVSAGLSAGEDVWLHVIGNVSATDMALGGEH